MRKKLKNVTAKKSPQHCDGHDKDQCLHSDARPDKSLAYQTKGETSESDNPVCLSDNGQDKDHASDNSRSPLSRSFAEAASSPPVNHETPDTTKSKGGHKMTSLGTPKALPSCQIFSPRNQENPTDRQSLTETQTSDPPQNKESVEKTYSENEKGSAKKQIVFIHNKTVP